MTIFKILKELDLSIMSFMELPYYWSDNMKIIWLLICKAKYKGGLKKQLSEAKNIQQMDSKNLDSCMEELEEQKIKHLKDLEKFTASHYKGVENYAKEVDRLNEIVRRVREHLQKRPDNEEMLEPIRVMAGEQYPWVEGDICDYEEFIDDLVEILNPKERETPRNDLSSM